MCIKHADTFTKNMNMYSTSQVISTQQSPRVGDTTYVELNCISRPRFDCSQILYYTVYVNENNFYIFVNELPVCKFFFQLYNF